MSHNLKEPSQRQLRVGEEIRHALSSIFLRGDTYHPENFSVLAPIVSEVRVSPDMHNATVYISDMASRVSMDDVVSGLNSIAGNLRSQVARKIYLKRTPALHFKQDQSFDRAAKVETLLNQPEVKRDISNEVPDE